MKIDVDKEIEYDGVQFTLTVATPSTNKNGEAVIAKKKTYHSTVEDLARKVSELELGKFVRSNTSNPEIISLYDALNESILPFVNRLKMSQLFNTAKPITKD